MTRFGGYAWSTKPSMFQALLVVLVGLMFAGILFLPLRPELIAALLTAVPLLAITFGSPWGGLLAALLALPEDYPSRLIGLGSRTVFEIVLALTSVSLLLRFVAPRRRRASWELRNARALAISVGAWTLLTILQFGRSPELTLDETVLNSPGKVLFRTVVASLLFLLIICTITSRRRLDWTVLTLGLASLVPMVWGDWLGMTHTLVSAPGELVVSRSVSFTEGLQWRVGSTFGDPFSLSLEACLALTLAIAYILIGNRRGLRVAVVGMACLAALAIVVSQVRAAGLAVMIGVLVMTGLVRGRARLWLVGVLAVGTTALIGGLATGYIDLGRLLVLDDASTATRFALWQFSLKSFLNSPIVGSGLSSFAILYDRFYDSPLQIGDVSAHSTIFSVAVDMGILGLLALALQIGAAMRTAWQTFRRRPDWLSIGLLAALTTTIPALCTQDVYINRGSMYQIYALLGLIAANARLSVDEKYPDSSTPAVQRAAVGEPGRSGR